jgi:hypothetical protein
MAKPVPYEVTIVCEHRRGNPLEKKRCHSDAQARAPQPFAEHTTSRLALSTAEGEARRLGWKRQQRPSRPTIWACPVCAQE